MKFGEADINFEVKTFRLQLKSPFKIAHGVSTYRDTVILVLKYGDIEGIGEAPVVLYYGSDRDSLVEEIEEFISGLRINSVFKTLIKGWDKIDDLAELFNDVGVDRLSFFARSAVTTAFLDVASKHLEKPLGEYLGLALRNKTLRNKGDEKIVVPTMLTITERDVGALIERIGNLGKKIMVGNDGGIGGLRARFILKVKLGFDNDVEIFTEALIKLRKRFPVDRIFRFAVDVNQGWSNVDLAEKFLGLSVLLTHNFSIEFVEEPVNREISSVEDFGKLKISPIPIFLDESIKSLDEIERLVAMVRGGGLTAVKGIVIKLGKIGGPLAAVRGIRLAKSVGLRVMIGCFIESGVGIAAAMHTAGECDYVDLDAPFLVENDPARGVEAYVAGGADGEIVDGVGVLRFPYLPGLGVSLG